MIKINKKGFTLIELLIVIAIIGVLVTIVVIAINPARLIQDARDSTRRSDLQQVKASLQLYYNDCKTYPPTTAFNTLLNAGSEMGGTADADGVDDDVATTCDNNQTYMRQLPDDPGFVYTLLVGAQNYTLTAVLANPNDDDADTITKCSPAEGNFAVCND